MLTEYVKKEIDYPEGLDMFVFKNKTRFLKFDSFHITLNKDHTLLEFILDGRAVSYKMLSKARKGDIIAIGDIEGLIRVTID